MCPMSKSQWEFFFGMTKAIRYLLKCFQLSGICGQLYCLVTNEMRIFSDIILIFYLFFRLYSIFCRLFVFNRKESYKHLLNFYECLLINFKFDKKRWTEIEERRCMHPKIREVGLYSLLCSALCMHLLLNY